MPSVTTRAKYHTCVTRARDRESIYTQRSSGGLGTGLNYDPSTSVGLIMATPPFTRESANAKVKKAQDLWNTQDPVKIAKVYTPDSIWRNRDKFLVGTQAIEKFLSDKWEKEKSYRLRKELFTFDTHKIAVQFWYEFQDAHDGMKWKRCFGIEHWTFQDDGLMRKRQMSGNDVEISDEERWFKDGVDVNSVDISEQYW